MSTCWSLKTNTEEISVCHCHNKNIGSKVFGFVGVVGFFFLYFGYFIMEIPLDLFILAKNRSWRLLHTAVIEVHTLQMNFWTWSVKVEVLALSCISTHYNNVVLSEIVTWLQEAAWRGTKPTLFIMSLPLSYLILILHMISTKQRLRFIAEDKFGLVTTSMCENAKPRFTFRMQFSLS